MQDLPNIEKSAFRPGQYVGYAAGVWYIAHYGNKGALNYWRATRTLDGKTIYGPTLAHLSTVLTKIAA